MVEDYEEMPVPDLTQININFDAERLFKREPLKYTEEVKQGNRKELDRAVLLALGFPEKEIEQLVEKLHEAFVAVVEDRLIKAKGPAEVPAWQE
jgi:Holliday junction resolvasome RuvABC DNA-binding subunit